MPVKQEVTGTILRSESKDRLRNSECFLAKKPPSVGFNPVLLPGNLQFPLVPVFSLT
jgi:hypothetical protein